MPALYRDFGFVENQRKNTVALLARQRSAERDGRMAAKRHFGFGREVTYPPGIVHRHRKRGFRVTHLGGDTLHFGIFWQLVGNHHAGGISTLAVVGKSRDFRYVHVCMLRMKVSFIVC